MIDAANTSSGSEPADVVAGWMVRALELAGECADDVQRINLLSAFESMKAVCAGGQATVTVGFAATQTAEGLAVGTEPEVIRRSVAGQVALARRDAQHRGGRHVGLAVALHTELPHTRKALDQGSDLGVAGHPDLPGNRLPGPGPADARGRAVGAGPGRGG